MDGSLDERADEPADRRAFVRLWVYRNALLSIPGQMIAQPCSVRDLTVEGASIRLNGTTLLPMEFEISFDGFRTLQLCRLIWRDGDFAGIVFRGEHSGPRHPGNDSDRLN